uniref:G-patch domain-containing protein n=1 Tax=Kalanchoe fedtschenkoi TaxID=63787 RepID=A0A7N0RH09_KALFE
MAEFGGQLSQEDEDYMGDLSRFLPPEEASISTAQKAPPPASKRQKLPSTLKEKPKNKSWQEIRRVEREKKQIEEDALTLEKIEKAPIPQSNIGFKLLRQMGYIPGSVLGKEGSGRAEPVGIEIRRSRAGIGREDPHKEKMKIEEMMAERKRRMEKIVMEDFGSRQKEHWRTRRVTVNYEKAKKALDHLENKPVEVKKKGEEEDDESEEEEEEEITEEDLLRILTQLREQHFYCLFCGCKYESMEVLLSSCPGLDEDDH